jgi:hypothetical protein
MQGLVPRVEEQNILQANAFNMEGSNKIELYIIQFLRLLNKIVRQFGIVVLVYDRSSPYLILSTRYDEAKNGVN